MLAAGTADEDDKGSLGADATVRFDMNEVRSPAPPRKLQGKGGLLFRSKTETRRSITWALARNSGTNVWSGKRTPPKKSARFARDPGIERGAEAFVMLAGSTHQVDHDGNTLNLQG